MNPPDGSAHPVMTAAFLADQVAPLFRKRPRYLDAVRAHGSPLYLLESGVLRDRAQAFRSTFQACLPDTRFY